MTEFAGWLPETTLAALAVEDGRDAAEDARQRREAEARRAAWEDKNEGAFRAHARLAYGEHIAAVDIMNGSAGKTLQEVLVRARGNLERDYAPQQRADERFYGEARIHASRSGWPESEYARDRQLRQADEMHRSLVEYQARRDYAGAEARARAKSEAVRSSPAGYDDEVTRLVAAGFSPETARQAATPMIFR
jgi:hypothetical protein